MLLLKEVEDSRQSGTLLRRFFQSMALVAVAPLVVACVQPTVRPIVGPSGDPTLFISCGDTGECYELAGRSCPNGYDIQRARGATLESYLVHCRAQPSAEPVYYSARSTPATYPQSYSQPAQQQAWGSNSTQPWAQAAPPPPPAPDGTQGTTASDAPNAMSMPRPIGSSDFDLGY